MAGFSIGDLLRLLAAATTSGKAAARIEKIASSPTSDPELRARAIAMLPRVCRDDERLDDILMAAVRSSNRTVFTAAAEVIAAMHRTQLGPQLLLLLAQGKPVAELLVSLGDSTLAASALSITMRAESPAITLARILLAAEIGGRDSLEPLRPLAESQNPDVSAAARGAIARIGIRLQPMPGRLSICEPIGELGRLSVPVGGELSNSESGDRDEKH